MDKSAKYQGLSAANRAIAAFEALAANDTALAAVILLSEPEASAGNAQIVECANAALGAMLAEDAAKLFENSARVAALIDQMTVALSENADAPRASSSGYHFRLAARHGDAFSKASRSRHAAVYAVMRAIVCHHTALMRGDVEWKRTQAALSALIDEAFGTASIEARTARANTLSERAECNRARAEKLRAVTHHMPATADLTPEIALTAMVILPSLPVAIRANNLPMKERA